MLESNNVVTVVFSLFFTFFLLVAITEAEDIRADNSIDGTDIKSHDALLANISTFATSSMRKSIILSNGTSNAVHEVNSTTGTALIEFRLRYCLNTYHNHHNEIHIQIVQGKTTVFWCPIIR